MTHFQYHKLHQIGMQMSEDENIKIEEEVNAFRNIIPTRRKGQVGGHGAIGLCPNSESTKDQCLKLMNEILSARIQDTVQKICDTIRENRTSSKSIVIVLNIKRNQKKDLQKFVDKFANYNFELTNSLKSISVKQIAKDDVRDIALEIQIKEDLITQHKISQKKVIEQQENGEANQKPHLILYVNTKVTNLSQSNIHVFEGSVIKANYAAIIPTFQNLKIVDGLGIMEQNEMFYFQAYNNKQLFIQFFYRCLVSKKIMAYLPQQILGLIKLYDYYPISYQQGCNMLIYACQTYDAKCQQSNRPKKKYVDVKELIRVFNRTWKIIWNDEMEVARYNYYQLSHVILDQRVNYQVPEKKILNFIRMNSAKDTGVDDLNQKNFYKRFLTKFREKLQSDQNLKHLSKYFDEYEDRKTKQEVKKMKKKARQISLGFEHKTIKSEKQDFEDKITFLFKQATAQIRRQAKYVEWQDLRVFQMFQPQIVKDTADGIMQDSEFRDIFNAIRSNVNFPMGRLIERFKGIQIGKLVYMIRCMELKGLVQLTKNTLRPSLMTNFYDKARYKMSGNE